VIRSMRASVTFLAVLLLCMTLPLAAGALGISGTVTDASTTDPLSGVMVDVFEFDVPSGEWIATEFASTDASGAYTIAGLGAGSYRVGFNAFGDAAARSRAYWQAKTDLASADTIALAGDVAGIDATLTALPLSLEGTVTAQGSGEPLADIVATLWREVAGQWEIEATAFTDIDGVYRFYGLDAGPFRVGFSDPFGVYADEYYDDEPLIADGADVAVPAAGVSAQLSAGVPAASGKVVRAVGGEPIPGCVVTAYRFDTVDQDWVAIEDTTTVADGSWTMYGLGNEEWRFGVVDPSTIHAPRFYDGQATVETADSVLTTAGLTASGIDIGLFAQIPSLSGSVEDSVTAAPIGTCEVEIYRFDAGSGQWVSHLTTSTTSDGHWQVFGLYDGSWRVGFNRGSISNPDYFEQFFSQTRDIAEAQTVNTLTNTELSGIGVRMVPRPPSIEGTVTRAIDSSALAGIRVTASRLGFPPATQTTVTAADGSYRLKVLPDGDYHVVFEDPTSVGGVYPYRTQYFDGRADETSADAVSVVESASARADAVLVIDEPFAPRTRFIGVASALRQTQVSVVATEPAEESGIRELNVRLDAGATQTVTPGAPGTEASATLTITGYWVHTVRYSAVDLAGNVTPAETATVTLTPPPVTRVAGSDRYAVAAAIARGDNPGWSGVTDVVLASGEDRAAADPLAAAGLCWAYGSPGKPAPLLLTGSASVASNTEQAIAEMVSRNTTVTLHVVGGTVSVPAARIAEIRAAVASRLGISAAQATARVRFERLLATGSRYDMAAAIAARMVQMRGSEATASVMLANGAEAARFYDALAVTPISARTGAPVLLVSANSVSAATVDALEMMGTPGSSRYVAGGPASVSAAVMKRLSVPAGNRMSGPDRYSTAVAVANRAIGEGWLDARNIGIAARVPDALTGGVSIGGDGGVVLFTDSRSLSAPTAAFLGSAYDDVERCVVFGGTSSVSPAVFDQIVSALD